MGDLARLSVSDQSFQRDLIKRHGKAIVRFLQDSENLFFPEVVLGCTLRYDFQRGRTGMMPIGNVADGRAFESNVDGLKVTAQKVAPRRRAEESRATDVITLTTVEVPDEQLSRDDGLRLFRIDGNHRLSAAQDTNEFDSLRTPFCIVFFPDEREADRRNKIIFHNINAKAVPLTSEENLRIILDDENLFSDDDLKNLPAFGWEFYFARALSAKLGTSPFDYLDHIRKVFQDRRTALVELCRYLLERKILSKRVTAVETVFEALKEINNLYAQLGLGDNSNAGLLTAFVYFRLKEKSGEKWLDAFGRWVRGNQLHRLNQVEAKSLVEIFEQIMNARRRTIFVSMQFGDKTKSTYSTVARAVSEVNQERGLEIKLHPIRVDEFNPGYSYTITDEILRLIEDSGLLIVDLTFGNKNVYHELGYLMGLNRGRGLPHRNFILLVRNREEVDTYKEIGFNIRHWQQIRFNEMNELHDRLKRAIEIYYGFAGEE
ncbi:MAG: hypothetical protein M3347_03120 [Armatimonadota bacterium]|nr:hypothetical protein [Armatimonadota bacterium]